MEKIDPLIHVKRICDHCGEEHPLMQDNKDGTWTCLPCLNEIDDGNDIDNFMLKD